ncbi:hypothetical protein VNO80_26777 [Phaseolus coccineus]|uniref:Uncharacterized protein n=1 Tax=Phaseolus coccineus TaxID=3886 RepID=A0AAN9LJ45_PHACN
MNWGLGFFELQLGVRHSHAAFLGLPWIPQRRRFTLVEQIGLENEERSLVFAIEDWSVWMWDVEKREVIMVFGDKLITISDMIVIKGNGGGFGDAKGNNNVTLGEGNGSFTSLSRCLEF